MMEENQQTTNQEEQEREQVPQPKSFDETQSKPNDSAHGKPGDGALGKPFMLLLPAAILIAVFFFFSPGAEPLEEQAAESAAPAVDYFEDIDLAAKSAYVVDLKTDTILFEKDPETQLPLASLTKIMTAYVVLEHLPRETRVAITEDAIATEGDSGLLAGERWPLESLIEIALIESSNDAAYALAGAAGAFKQAADTHASAQSRFISMMNSTARDLGLAQTYFLNPIGLDENEQVSGGYGSARDYVRLFTHFADTYPELASASGALVATIIRENGEVHESENTNGLLGIAPNIFVSKTGYTELAGGNLAVIFDAGLNHPVAAVVLGSTYEGRFEDMDAIIDAALNTIALENAQ